MLKFSQLVHPRGDGGIVVSRVPNWARAYTLMDFWRPKNTKSWWKRKLQSLAYKILIRWGEQYQHVTETKHYNPLHPDDDVHKAIHRQVHKFIMYDNLNPDDLVFFVGHEKWDEILIHASVGMPDLAIGRSGGITKYRGMQAIIVPDMIGVLVVPKAVVRKAINQ